MAAQFGTLCPRARRAAGQDTYAALNPLHTVEYALTRPVINFTGLHGREARGRVLELLETVGLSPVEQFAAKLPHQLSGGQRQRVVIARALASGEIVSASVALLIKKAHNQP